LLKEKRKMRRKVLKLKESQKLRGGREVLVPPFIISW
jgi:hypothetical protein